MTLTGLSRSGWISVLAKAALSELEAGVTSLGDLPAYEFLRSPEIGLAMVRGRAEGTGQPFNLGEMTIVRCVVQLVPSASGTPTNEEALTGFGYVAGRSLRHAELAAVCDALLQQVDWQDRVERQVIQPLQVSAQANRQAAAAEVESTRVNFFTLLRGEG
ncbi:phosphonate C-P lyase system protein PhnG [Rubidibacter lacunae KORDI 51-2]|uniref:Phosphonate C-P lyase system protein PhnG n=1 Tax=Rubidibacter lacunae KORDI 51-2 TaxID=582515 RepID=U5DEG7_9CHRO|nr:phosphonate C-P lyase system protein PhnG [Rubidibacter lacunae]ERN42903.1 phosphonate C-P lyase system protein PhnG [Rubidibacter lacunae KORDI 51-2]